MRKELRKTILYLSQETLFILLTIASAVILPQILHTAGAALGIGGKLGQIFLPMYLPVLIIGFYRGPVSGVLVGLFAPLVSFAVTGMPQMALLPYITVELVSLGLFAGVFAKVKMDSAVRVASVQVLAKLIRTAVFAVALAVANLPVTAPVLFEGVLSSIPGIVIQLVLMTYLIEKKDKKRNA